MCERGSREESKQRGFSFADRRASLEKRAERCIVTDEMKPWQMEGGRLEGETKERIAF